MSYSFGSYPTTASAFPNFNASYGGFSGLTSGFSTGGLTSFAQPAQFSSGFATSFPATSFPAPSYTTAPTGFTGYTGAFGATAQPSFGTVFGATTPAFGGFNTLGGVYSAPAAGSNFAGGFNSAYSQAVAFPSSFPTANFGGFSNPAFATPAAIQQQALAVQQGDEAARPRAVSNIEYGLGVPTLVPKTKEEEALQRTPSGNLPRREASRGELSRRYSTPHQQAQVPLQGPQNAMASYLAQNCALDARTAQAIGGSTLSPRNLGAPTGHRGSNPREQVPW